MAWTDEFNDVAWTNGDYLSEIKLDQMVANERWAQDQIGVINIPGPDDYRHLGDFNRTEDTYEGVAFGTWVFELLINTTVISTSSVTSAPGWTTVRSINTGNTALSLITPGSMFDLGFKWTRSGGLIGESKIEVVRTQAMNYLTFGFIWDIGYYNYDPTGSDREYRRALWKNVWVVSHSNTETW